MKQFLSFSFLVLGLTRAMVGFAEDTTSGGGPAAAGAYAFERTQPEKALILTMERKPWQALAAVCLTPAFLNHEHSTPLLFDDGSEKRDVPIDHETSSLESFGADAAAATAKIATKYWKKAESVFVVDTYEQALWVVPCAALLGCPILVNPTQATLTTLGVKRTVVVGASKPATPEVVRLTDKEGVWKFQLDLLASRGQKCDYIVMTNPHDTDEKPNPNIQWPNQSLAAAPLAAYRRAIVQTGDYTADRQKLHALGGALGKKSDKAKYVFITPALRKVKDASYAVEKFMADAGHKPEFLGMVGCVVALPYYVCDIHTHYKYWDLEVHYVPADTPYATMRTDVDFTRFVKPDLAPGRILADSVLDATLMLTKTFFYRDFMTGGRYAKAAPAGWDKKALLIDGHRLNQPDEGGPPTSATEPFYPSTQIVDAMTKGGLTSEYAVPRDATKDKDPNPSIQDLLQKSGQCGAVQFVAHGDPPFIRVEIGRRGKEAKNFNATGPQVRALTKYDAPTSVYVIGCHTGTVYAPFASNEEYLPTSFVHAGTVAYIAPHTCQAVCFWRYAPKGPAASQSVYFWENALTKGMPVGKALIEAKARAYDEWKDKQYEKDRGKDTDNAAEPDGSTVLLFGDPALVLEKAK